MEQVENILGAPIILGFLPAKYEIEKSIVNIGAIQGVSFDNPGSRDFGIKTVNGIRKFIVFQPGRNNPRLGNYLSIKAQPSWVKAYINNLTPIKIEVNSTLNLSSDTKDALRDSLIEQRNKLRNNGVLLIQGSEIKGQRITILVRKSASINQIYEKAIGEILSFINNISELRGIAHASFGRVDSVLPNDTITTESWGFIEKFRVKTNAGNF